MATISFGGLSSGLDTSSIIAELVRIERMPIVRLEQRKSAFQSQLSIVGDVIAKLQTLQSKAQGLDTLAEVYSYTAISSDSTVFAATASGDAQPGTYGIRVSQLAAAERTYSAGFASKTATGVVGTGTLTITVGSDAPVSVAIDEATDTLETVAQKINSSGARVTASIVYDGASYRLVVTGKDTGAANAIAFSDPTDLDLDVGANQRQAATDSRIVLDGFTISRPTNVVSDVIQGVTLDLLKTSGATVTLTVGADAAAVRAKVEEIVAAYNSLAEVISSQSRWTGEVKGENTLAGDSTLRGVLQRLQSIVSSPVAGLSGRYSSLAEVGVKTNRNGTLALDGAALDAALATDLRGVALLFAREGATTGVAAQIDAAAKSMTDSVSGSLTLRKSGIDQRIRDIDRDIERLEFNVSKTEARLQAQFAALEQLMASLQAQTVSIGNTQT